MPVRYIGAVADSTELAKVIPGPLPGVAGIQFKRDDNTVQIMDPDGVAGTFLSFSPATALLAATGVAVGYKIARGVTALDGLNPTPVATGLATVVAAVATLEGTAAPGVGTSVLTLASTNYATGALAVYAWKVTSNADPTLIASTGTENFEWIAIGT